MPAQTPEQHRKEPYTKAVDIYAFGVMLYDVACQEPPFDVGEGEEGDQKQAEMCLEYAESKKLSWTNGLEPAPVSEELKALGARPAYLLACYPYRNALAIHR